jgi:hypothetical protein
LPKPEVVAEGLSHALSILPACNLALGGVLPKIVLGVVQKALELHTGLSNRVPNIEIGIVFEFFIRQAQ